LGSASGSIPKRSIGAPGFEPASRQPNHTPTSAPHWAFTWRQACSWSLRHSFRAASQRMCLRVFRRGGAPVRGRPESTKYIGAALQLLRSPVELSRVCGVLRQQGPGRSTEPMAAASGAAVMRQFAQALHKRRCKPLDQPAQIAAVDN